MVYEERTYVTALVPSETACLASSPGNKSRTAVWISRDEIVWRLLYWANRDASLAIRSTTNHDLPLHNHLSLISPTENIVDKAVHNRHGFTRNTRIRMDLFRSSDDHSFDFNRLLPVSILCRCKLNRFLYLRKTWRSKECLMNLWRRYERFRLLPFFSAFAPVLLAPLFDGLLMIFDPFVGVLGGIFSFWDNHVSIVLYIDTSIGISLVKERERKNTDFERFINWKMIC